MPDLAQPRASKAALFSWALYDWANSSFPTLVQTFVFAAYFTRRVAENETVGSSQWGTMVGVSGLFIAVGGPILGAIADHTGRRKPWIAAFTILCVICSGLLWLVKPSPDWVPLALLLVGLGTLGMEYSAIFYNCMLADITPPGQLGRWSGWGWGLGYAGGLACLLIALFGFIGDNAWFDLDRSSAAHVRIAFPLVAIWFLLFSLPLFLLTPDMPRTGKSFATATRDGMRQLVSSIRQVRKYAPILRFLIARMIYIDGLATVFAFGGVYAAGTFDMNEKQVLMFGIALNVTAGIGAALFAWLDDKIGSKPTILLSLVGLSIPMVTMLLTDSYKVFWCAGLVLGIFVGPVQAASRTYLARMAPPEMRNQMFGLYVLSGKATSFLGPFMVGWITYWAGSQRAGMSSILIFFIVGFLLMLSVPAATRGEAKT